MTVTVTVTAALAGQEVSASVTVDVAEPGRHGQRGERDVMATLCVGCLQPVRPVNECICEDEEPEDGTEGEVA